MIEGPIAVAGVTGRLGSAIHTVCQHYSIPVTATSRSTGWVFDTDRIALVIDASVASAIDETILVCDRTDTPLLYCVSNPPATTLAKLHALGRRVPVGVVANLSPLHWVQSRAAALSGELLAKLAIETQATVVDRHPPTKRDAPSATARVLAGVMPEPVTVVSERSGRPVSDHRVVLTAAGETYELSHSVRDLRLAASAAVRLGAELATAAPGLYSADDLYSRVIGRERHS
ncbi:hypothetical protein FMUBM48_30610 [Nocardia cyriacigeorgica]|nr:hypothetical protein FMUBM48_30610 [Nocardia cyriacigeorgica]